MNRALEFHDSDVESMSFERDCVLVRFSDAYIHASEGTPGFSPGDGFLQAADLVFSDVTAEPFSSSAGALSDGCVRVNGTEYSLLPIPFQAQGHVTAELVFSSGQRISIEAKSVQCTTRGEARWLEKYDD